jgi:dTDP-D-glucose 4,6-dehydratase
LIVLDRLTYAGHLANLAEVLDDPGIELGKADISDGELLDGTRRPLPGTREASGGGDPPNAP